MTDKQKLYRKKSWWWLGVGKLGCGLALIALFMLYMSSVEIHFIRPELAESDAHQPMLMGIAIGIYIWLSIATLFMILGIVMSFFYENRINKSKKRSR